jgi:hypothetical protein
MEIDFKSAAKILDNQLAPWEEAIAHPAHAQESVLRQLLRGYAQTTYGQEHHASEIDSIDAFRNNFPILNYDQYKPLIKRVMDGETELLLSEPIVGWAITRGTTQGESKFIPMTATDLNIRVSAGRAMMNFVLRTKRFELFNGINLNLNFPSVVGKIKAGDQEITYGYSSGIYTKHVSNTTPIKSIPTQDEIDALGGGKSRIDWEKRFDLTYHRCKDQNVTLVGGVAPTAIRFARFLHKKYHVYPKKLWEIQIMTLGSIAGINTRYQPALNALFGPAAIREIYGATEGMFGQQRDDKKAWTPNYDLYFFEAITPTGIKMLHELRPGEMGALVVSTPILARYRIGDLIRAFHPPYFRCIGREKWWTFLSYAWNELATLNLDQI